MLLLGASNLCGRSEEYVRDPRERARIILIQQEVFIHRGFPTIPTERLEQLAPNSNQATMLSLHPSRTFRLWSPGQGQDQVVVRWRVRQSRMGLSPNGEWNQGKPLQAGLFDDEDVRDILSYKDLKHALVFTNSTPLPITLALFFN